MVPGVYDHPLVAEQYFDCLTPEAVDMPEKRLMLAVLFDEGDLATAARLLGRPHARGVDGAIGVRNVPTLVNTVIVPNAATLGDVQTSDDGQLLRLHLP